MPFRRKHINENSELFMRTHFNSWNVFLAVIKMWVETICQNMVATFNIKKAEQKIDIKMSQETESRNWVTVVWNLKVKSAVSQKG